MTSFPRGSTTRPSAPSPVGLWLARAALVMLAMSGMAWIASWVAYYTRF